MFFPKSQFGSQALFALVALFILVLFAALQQHASDRGVTQQRLSEPTGVHGNRQSVPFGRSHNYRPSKRLAEIRSTHSWDHTHVNASTFYERPPHVSKRDESDDESGPNVPINLDDYVCKGQIYLKNMREAKPDQEPKWAFSNLAHNGWRVSGTGPTELSVEVQAAMRANGIPLDAKDNPERTASLDNSFVNFRQEMKISLGGEYQQIYNVAGGAILALYNESPTAHARVALHNPALAGDALKAVIPPMSTWADLTWAIWLDTCTTFSSSSSSNPSSSNLSPQTPNNNPTNKNKASTLRYILRHNIFTRTTLSLIDLIEHVQQTDPAVRPLRLPWPGHTYALESKEGMALLGSLHGGGVSWLYVVGRKTLGERPTGEMTVTVFTGPRPPPPAAVGGGAQGPERGDFYFLLFYLGEAR
ncbi:MAG: hypothetical protein Q9184_007547 [Pyrenodesmia sp. 2 TL-2023]